MNLAEWSLRNNVTVWVLTVLMVVVGASSFFNLSWLEDPEFTIKEAVVITPYPGASASEVEEEVTNVIERAVQELGQLKFVQSRSSRGRSEVNVTIKDQYDKSSLPQVWDELRRKVNDAQRNLPPGAGPSVVNDDFGDVYGVYVALTGKGYTPKERYEVAKFLQRELLGAEDVKRITLYGALPETIYVEMQRDQMSRFGVSPEAIFAALEARNIAVPAGNLTVGDELVAVNPTGGFRSEEQFGDLLIRGGGEGGNLVQLGDVAEIKRGYQDPPDTILRVDGQRAIGLGISTVEGGNVVTMGQALKERFEALQDQLPIGMETHPIAVQSDAVVESVRGFLVNLIEAVVIVVLVLLLFMGLRSGLIIGAVLLVTICGTFLFMDLLDITLQRISLGALVIALGMLVDNAIVVTDGMRVRMQRGQDAETAARDVVGQTGIPLLGATVIAVLAFAAIGTSQDSTGEYTRTLFQVVMISLLLSWVTAVTTTPLLCKTLLKRDTPGGDQAGRDPYSGGLFQGYRRFLILAIRHRGITLLGVLVLFLAALAAFGAVPKSFFPDSTRPQFYVDFWFPQGTRIEEAAERMRPVEQYLRKQEGVTQVATQVGGSQVRFLLTYPVEKLDPRFAQALVSVDDYREIPEMIQRLQRELPDKVPDAVVNARQFILGPSTGGKLQLRISGPDPRVLRRLAEEAQGVMEEDPASKGVRNEWGNMAKVVRPELAETQASRAGIDRTDLGQAMEMAVEGSQVGVYREEDELLPIVARLPSAERFDLDNLGSIPVWSEVAGEMIAADQVVTGFRPEFENTDLWRRDRTTMLRLHADVDQGLPAEMLNRIKAPIEKALGVDTEAVLGHPVPLEEWGPETLPVEDMGRLPLKGMPGYSIAWGGEAEDSARANASLAGYVPIFFGLMVLMVIILFNSIKKTLVIWLTVPLSIIGVTVGLLLFGQPFGFMALLGLMSLTGMLIKNAVVLIDQIGAELGGGKPPFQAVVHAGLSRLIPVSMAALTTILGMAPLVTDAFFVAMAVTIMFGLGFATLLTLVIVPVLYSVLFRVPSPANNESGEEQG
ncbi:multidrug transporter AcrB [Thiohalorhabdus denitrificans]|uniref:Multidrug efflux pump subunit AcrB n=1 Tax=Thiohalorhabdus denitrificans TaxID=381306 RepID=A0A0P9C3B3_9GAMM|nr:efflux RND transporter permease subunit [Thiohalorhabdus denitrificans]KPV39187.1 multidrug transporter AcrB [Thiohalorhabdus denitrificans]SCX75589.1 Multidrug efflux pump subunit AcrB [Thiohalorhabdus denitrificans]